MGGILVYQKGGKPISEIHDLFHWMVFVSELEQAVHMMEAELYRLIMIHLDHEDESGLLLASVLRSIPGYQLTPILFLAPDHRYEREAFYDYHCYDYLVKPVRQEEMIRIIYPLITQLYTEKQEKWLKVKVHGDILAIPLCDIIYMESVNRSVDIHTVGEILNIPYLQLKYCLQKYKAVFVQCHRCVLVNRQYVQKVDYRKRKIELQDCVVDIGRQFESVLRREFDGWEIKRYNSGKKNGGTNERNFSDSSWAAVQ